MTHRFRAQRGNARRSGRTHPRRGAARPLHTLRAPAGTRIASAAGIAARWQGQGRAAAARGTARVRRFSSSAFTRSTRRRIPRLPFSGPDMDRARGGARRASASGKESPVLMVSRITPRQVVARMSKGEPVAVRGRAVRAELGGGGGAGRRRGPRPAADARARRDPRLAEAARSWCTARTTPRPTRRASRISSARSGSRR